MDQVMEYVAMAQSQWQKWDANSDPRTADWLLVSDPRGIASILAAYVAFVIIMPRIMSYCKPFSFKYVMIVYNFAIASLSIYMCIEFFLVALNFNWFCEPVDYSNTPIALRTATICHVFYLSKYVEFLDTFFFIMRKKTNQVSFLHVYHHISITLTWFVVCKWYPGGGVFFSGMLNSSVHVCMYTYYLLSALGPALQPYLWWKRYLTRFQITQFVAIAAHNCGNAFGGCGFPSWFANTITAYMLSLICLFLNFYIKAYSSKKTKRS